LIQNSRSWRGIWFTVLNTLPGCQCDDLSDQDVLGIDHELLMQKGRAYLAVIVRWRAIRSPEAADTVKTGAIRRTDRCSSARASGVVTRRGAKESRATLSATDQLAEVVKRRPQTLAPLAETNDRQFSLCRPSRVRHRRSCRRHSGRSPAPPSHGEIRPLPPRKTWRTAIASQSILSLQKWSPDPKMQQ